MKKIFRLFNGCILGIGYTLAASPPEFVFPIAFEDAAGNKDTVEFGYDIDATDSIDAEFGELNIIHEPFDSLLEVRIAEKGGRSKEFNPGGVFSTKRQINRAACNSEKAMNILEIYTRNWPVTATWDSALFSGICPKGGGITGTISDGLSYTDLYNTEFAKKRRITFGSHGGSTNHSFGYPYQFEVVVSGNGLDTANIFWVTLSTEALTTPSARIEDIPPKSKRQRIKVDRRRGAGKKWGLDGRKVLKPNP